MAILNAKVTGYLVGVSMFSQSDLERTIHVQLEGDLAAVIRFVQDQPAEWISFEEFAVVVILPLRFFDDMYRVLQTEAPVFFVARAEEDPSLFFTSFGTAREAVGEGPTDGSALT